MKINLQNISTVRVCSKNTMSRNISVYDYNEKKNYQFRMIEYTSDPDEVQLEKEKKEIEDLNSLLCEINDLKDVNLSLNKLVHEQHDDLHEVTKNVEMTETQVENAVVQLEKAQSYNKRGYVKGAIVTTTLLLASFPIGVLIGVKTALVVGAVGLVGGGAVMAKK